MNRQFPAAEGGPKDRRGTDLEIVPLRHRTRWLVAAVVLFLVFMVLQSLATNEAMHWDVIWKYLFDPSILDGMLLTVKLTVVSMVIGIVTGTVLAIMRLSANPVLKSVSGVYIWGFRGIPLLVQLLIFYFLAAVFPRIGLGIPYGPTFVSWDTNVLITQFMAAVLALGLNEGAYMAEIVRAGILSVDKGQSEAASSLGMSRFKALWKIVMPQAMRFIIPPTGNNTISMLKTTSLVLVIGLPDLLTSVQLIYARNFLQIPLLTVACFWYLVLVSGLTIVQYYTERRFGRGLADSPSTTAGQRIRGRIGVKRGVRA